MKLSTATISVVITLTVFLGAMVTTGAQEKSKPAPSPTPTPKPMTVETPATPAANPADVVASVSRSAEEARSSELGKGEHRAGGAFVHHPHKLSAWPCGFRVRPTGEAST